MHVAQLRKISQKDFQLTGSHVIKQGLRHEEYHRAHNAITSPVSPTAHLQKTIWLKSNYPRLKIPQQPIQLRTPRLRSTTVSTQKLHLGQNTLVGFGPSSTFFSSGWRKMHKLLREIYKYVKNADQPTFWWIRRWLAPKRLQAHRRWSANI